MDIRVEAGKLRHRVTIVQPAAIKGSMGGAQDALNDTSPVATVWAAVEPLAGDELFQGQQYSDEITTRITVRYLAGVTDKMQVQFGSEFYSIVAVINPQMRNIMLQLLCKERDNSAQ